MKYIYILVAVVIIVVGGYFLVNALSSTQTPAEEEVPEGFHRMSDGTLMRNSGGMEGMGAMEEYRESLQDAQAEQAIPADAKVFSVKGVNHKFDVTEIKVKNGETVTINFESTEGFHDWVVDEFGAATEKVQPGTMTSITFVADQSGTFEYYCSVGSHRAQGMVGKLIVE
jgi:plastocyanin